MSEILTPTAGSLHAHVFTLATKAQDEPLQRYISIGAMVEETKKSVARATTDPSDGLAAYEDTFKQPLLEYAHEQVDWLRSDRADTKATYFNANLVSSFLDQLVWTPTAYSSGALYGTLSADRKQLATGMYGLTVHVLRQAVSEYRTADPESDKTALRRFIDKATAQSLLLRGDNSASTTLPTLPFEDVGRAINLRAFLSRDGKPYSRPLQVKSSEWVAGFHRPDKTLLIGGVALGNSIQSNPWGSTEPIQTAQAILDDVDGTLHLSQQTTLCTIAKRLSRAVMDNRDFTAPKPARR